MAEHHYAAAQAAAGPDDRLHRLVTALKEGGQFGPGPVELRETHISLIALTGTHAYKFKKPVNLGFLDFATLAGRKRCCEEELRLNRRLAPDLYLGVQPVSGTGLAPVLGGSGIAIEYCVKMARFDAGSEFDALLQAGEIGAAEIDSVAATVARFHAAIAPAPPTAAPAAPTAAIKPALENCAALEPLLAGDTGYLTKLSALRQWTQAAGQALRGTLAMRHAQGFVRECHGDMHLGNIARLHGNIVIFDGIEFSEALRTIDVMSEVAFLTMDLDCHDRRDLGQRFLNVYLERTGDYDGLSVLRFYKVYRAMVRAKVAGIRLRQTGLTVAAAEEARRACRAYIELAESYIHPPEPFLLITHGLSGSGKSTVSLPLSGLLGAVRVRSDVERKRLHGLEATASSGSRPSAGLYAPAVSEQTYGHLRSLAANLLRYGYGVIVDATFLKSAPRQRFERCARAAGVPLIILSFRASAPALQRRVIARGEQGGDASEADARVLEQQLAALEPLDSEERQHCIDIDADDLSAPAAIAATAAEAIKNRLNRQGTSA